MSDTLIGRSIRPPETRFNPFVGEEAVTLVAHSKRSLTWKETYIVESVSSSGTQRTSRLRARETVVEMKEFLKIVHNIGDEVDADFCWLGCSSSL